MCLIKKKNVVSKKNVGVEFKLSLDLVPEFVEIDEKLAPDSRLMEFYTKQQRIFWTSAEIEYQEKDIVEEFPKLNEDYQSIIKSILLFFTVADKLVIGNLNTLKQFVPYKAAEYFLIAQEYIEAIHDQAYELSARKYYNNDKKLIEDRQLLDDIMETANNNEDELFDLDEYHSETYEKRSEIEKKVFRAVALKINLMNRWRNKKSFIHNFVAFFIMESLSFNALFALINTFKEYNRGLKYLIDINEFVSRDERIHAEFGLFLYKYFLLNKLPKEEFLFILREIAETEINFLRTLISADLKINNRTVEDYVLFIKEYANNISKYMDYGSLYEDVNSGSTESFNVPKLKVKHNFFERTGTYVNNNSAISMDAVLDMY